MKLALFLVVLLELPAFAQIEHGSIVIIYFSNDQIAVAADSRGSQEGGLKSNSYCKVFAFDHKLIFAVTNHASNSRTGISDLSEAWNSWDDARSAYKEALATHSETVVEQTADNWAKKIVSHWRQMYTFYPQRVRSLVGPNGGLTIGSFGGLDRDGHLVLVQIRILFQNSLDPISYSTTVLGSSDCMLHFCGSGLTDVGNEFLTQDTDWTRQEFAQWSAQKWPGKPEDKVLLEAIRLVDLTIAYSNPKERDELGGPIDALELKGDGSFRWFARKENCPEN